jgi:hypothetical protein
MTGSPTGMHKRSRQPHLFKSLQKEEVTVGIRMLLMIGQLGHLGLIQVGATKNIVDLLVRLEEVALGIRMLLMIGQLGHLENFICKTMESVALSSLVLPWGWRMQMRSR